MAGSDTALETQKASSTDAGGCAGGPKHGLIAQVLRGAEQQDILLLLTLLAFMLFWYGFLLGLPPIKPKTDLVFNSMLDHLLHGRFDVDPGIVGDEGFLSKGHVYAYWGIWCALLRLPLWIFGRINIDMTVWSCLAAVCLAAMAKLRTVLLLRRHGAQNQTARHAVQMMLAYVVLGGSEIGFLKAIIYQEVVLWAVAFAAVFVYFAIKGLVTQRFDAGTLSAMALSAGLALLTRVTTAIGLILALGMLLLVLTWQSSATTEDGHRRPIQDWLRSLLNRRILIPLGILAVCIVLTAVVNYFRWGNPLTFADFKLYIMKIKYPDRVLRDDIYGMFNLKRIPFTLIYYFLPIWAYQTDSGNFLFEHTQTRLFDCVELPPSTLFLTDLLPLCLIALLIVALWSRRSRSLPPARQWVAIAVGLAFPGILMLTYTYVAYRYRMEFYPEIDFLAFLGLYMVLMDDSLRAIYARHRVWIEAALIVSVAASFASLLLYVFTPFGPAQDLLHRGLVHGGRFIWY